MQDSLRRHIEFQKLVEESKYSGETATDSSPSVAKEPGALLLPQNRHLVSPSRSVSLPAPLPYHKNPPLEKPKNTENSRQDQIQEQLKRRYAMDAVSQRLQTEAKQKSEKQKEQPKNGLVRSLFRFIWKFFLWVLVFLIIIVLLFVALISQFMWWDADAIKLGTCLLTNVGCK